MIPILNLLDSIGLKQSREIMLKIIDFLSLSKGLRFMNCAKSWKSKL